MTFRPDDPTSRRRREVGVFARRAWTAVQGTLQRFRDVKEQRDDLTLAQARRACDEALESLERLQQALRSLRREISERRLSLLDWHELNDETRESTH